MLPQLLSVDLDQWGERLSTHYRASGRIRELRAQISAGCDLIGQLGDPMYSRKANALYCEFEEIGMNRQLGYSSPADIIDKYPAFFWNSVSMHLDDGIKYLNMTVSGRQWIANLHHHLLCAEHGHRFMGPQH